MAVDTIRWSSGILYKESTNEIWRSRDNVIGFWSIVMNLIAFGKRTNQRCPKSFRPRPDFEPKEPPFVIP